MVNVDQDLSSRKHIHTITITHVSNSIRTHGMGIINTTVNYTYQFLVRKLFIFSQFLFDDHIKSPCMREHRFFKQQKEDLNNLYPYSHAKEFLTQIERLGRDDGGKSFMDQFRGLITEIGNAMGYVRMVQSGGRHYAANSISFIPDLTNIEDFASWIEQENLSQVSIISDFSCQEALLKLSISVY